MGQPSIFTGKFKQLLAVLGNDEQVLILPHNDPDPDAIASVAALQYLLETLHGIHASIAFQGIIGRAENKALVQYLGTKLQVFKKESLKPDIPVILVDSQAGVGNNPLPAGILPRAVIDHHPYRASSDKVPFTAVYPDVGACATILTLWMRELDIEIPSALATALFYGIKTDTRGLSRDSDRPDVDAYFYLHPMIDMEALAKIEYARVPAEYFRSFSVALHTVRIYDERVVIAHIGPTSYPDMAAEVADELLRVEHSEWVLCTNVYNDMMVVSVRTHNADGDADQVVRAAVGSVGTAGGHGMMAGGQIALDGKDIEQLTREITDRTLHFLGVADGTLGESLV